MVDQQGGALHHGGSDERLKGVKHARIVGSVTTTAPRCMGTGRQTYEGESAPYWDGPPCSVPRARILLSSPATGAVQEPMARRCAQRVQVLAGTLDTSPIHV